MSRRWFFTSLAAALLLLGGVGYLAWAWYGKPQRLNVIVLTVESFRADFIRPDVTPNLLAAARSGVRFTNHRTIAAWTAPNVISVLTGTGSFAQGVHAQRQSVPSEWKTPLETLSDAGWRVRGLQSFMQIDTFRGLGLAIEPGEEPVPWLARQVGAPAPFALWYHYLGTHLPYKPSPGFMPDLEALLPPGDTAALDADGSRHEPADHPDRHRRLRTDRRRRRGGAACGDIPGVRRVVRKLLELLPVQRAGRPIPSSWSPPTMATSIWSAAMSATPRPPMTVISMRRSSISRCSSGLRQAVPRSESGQVIDAPTDHRDIMPTVMSRLGVKPEMPLEGRDLLNPDPANPYAWTALTSRAGFQEPDPDAIREFRTAIIDGRWKLQLFHLDGAVADRRLYDLQADPGERDNLADRHPDVVARLSRSLESAFASRRIVLPSAVASERDVEAPVWRIPASSGSVTLEAVAQGFRMEWNGKPDTDYVIQYQAGDGLLSLKGELEVQGHVEGTGSDRPGLLEELHPALWAGPYPRRPGRPE